MIGIMVFVSSFIEITWEGYCVNGQKHSSLQVPVRLKYDYEEKDGWCNVGSEVNHKSIEAFVHDIITDVKTGWRNIIEYQRQNIFFFCLSEDFQHIYLVELNTG